MGLPLYQWHYHERRSPPEQSIVPPTLQSGTGLCTGSQSDPTVDAGKKRSPWTTLCSNSVAEPTVRLLELTLELVVCVRVAASEEAALRVACLVCLAGDDALETVLCWGEGETLAATLKGSILDDPLPFRLPKKHWKRFFGRSSGRSYGLHLRLSSSTARSPAGIKKNVLERSEECTSTHKLRSRRLYKSCPEKGRAPQNFSIGPPF